MICSNIDNAFAFFVYCIGFAILAAVVLIGYTAIKDDT